MRNKGRELISIALGIIMLAIGIHFFLIPSKLSLGGASGMALVLTKFVNLPVGVLLVIINLFLFTLGFLVIGNKFAFKTIATTFTLSGVVWIFEIIFPVNAPIIKDTFLQLLIAVILYGGGGGIILNSYSAAGGSDIPAMIFKKYFGLDIGKGCILVDLIITICVGIVYGKELAFFSLIGVILNGLVIDYTIDGLSTSKFCTINTDIPEKISEFITGKLKRSANIYNAKGAYSKQDKTVIQTVVSTREFVKLKKFLAENEPEAFMVVTNATSVFGWQWKRISE